MNNIKSELLNEYFDIVSPLLAYEDCEIICETEQKVLALLCEMKDSVNLFEDCWTLIDSAKCLQTRSDVALLDSSDISHDSIVYDIKREVLIATDIKTIKRFNETNFVKKIKADANIGDVNSCKLLAVLNWNGSLLPQNKKIATKIWSFLAMSGDLLSMEMLIAACASEGNTEQQQKWLHIKDVLESEYNSFSAIATHSNYPMYNEEEIQIANLIMFISQKNIKRGSNLIDRPMIQYVLDSADDYKTKMSKMSSDTNYYLVMYDECKYSNKEYGF